MLSYPVIFVVSTSVLLIYPSDAFLNWLFRGKTGDGGGIDENPVENRVPMPRGEVPFEMKTTDEKFIMEAKAHMTKDLSALDTCHHLVIDELRGTCSHLSEEDLGKLAVQLLNCQSAAEGRPTFKCSRDMTIAECTGEMDPTTWNAYQIVSNRARAICYATRQQQFRMKAEYTVNKLVHTTENQVHAMHQIKEGQEKISEATTSTLEKLEVGQRDLEARQNSIKSIQMNIHTYIATNLRDLTKEKALISTGNKELAEMTDNIRQKLDNATKKLDAHEQNQRTNHKELLEDLSSIRQKAKEVWAKIDKSSDHMLQYHSDTTRHYQQTLENLQRVNATITYVLETVAKLETSVNQRLTWISTFMGGTGDRLALLSNVVLHTLFFLVAAVSATFLRTPMFSRIVLLLVVPINAWAEAKHQRSLAFSALTVFILLTVLLNWLVEWLVFKYQCCQSWKKRGSTLQSESDVDSPYALPVPFTSPESPFGNPAQINGLATPDLRKLALVLESLCKQGVLSPAVRRTIGAGGPDPPTSPSPGSRPEGHLLPDSPSDGLSDGDDDVDVPADPRRVSPTLSTRTAFDTPDILPTTSEMPPIENVINRTLTDSAKARVELVRRRLLNSPVGLSPLARPRVSGTRRASSPTPSRSSRTSNPSRPLCTATTRTGQLCRNTCSENSDFCYRHRPDGSNSSFIE